MSAVRLASREERPWGCRSLEVIRGTDCLPNTGSRCTWCGRLMPRPRYSTGEERSRRDAWLAGELDGTDPVEYEAGGPGYWETDPWHRDYRDYPDDPWRR